MKRIILQIVFILLGSLISSSNLHAQILLKEASLKKQIENSSLVVEGEVISKQSFWDADNKNIYTSNTVKVYKVFKGDLVETIEVITRGGTIGLSAEVVTPSLKLNTEDIGVFMLYDNNIRLSALSKSSKKQFKPYGSLQGFYKYNLYNDEAINPFNKKKGVTSFYKEIMGYTNISYVEVNSFHRASKQTNLSKSTLAAPGSITFTPTTTTAGTKTELTVNGTGFGTAKGKVLFSNADDGGSTFIEALGTQVLAWSDTQITVQIPSEAGTGRIRITDSGGASATSTSDLIITYSESNVYYDADDMTSTGGSNGPLPLYAYRAQHIKDNSSGGYTWEMFTDFNANANAKAAFLRAFETWRCTTGINWIVAGAVTTVDVASQDNVNVIRFDNGDELETDVLGQCISYYNGCSAGSTFNWFVYELDMLFDDATNWNYSSAINSTGISQYDFESVALHELGHGHQLAHVNDTNDVMHYALSNSEEQRVLGARNITAASAIQGRSTGSMVCAQPLMTNHPCYLSVEEEELDAAIGIYPNPTSGQFYIKNNSLINLDKIVVYDVRGRLISQLDASNASRTKTINLMGVSKGLYFVKILSERAEITKKILIE
ncbi:T9SS type A sorting domain-containing protein [Mariniflexile soesokkakense]|uniref:T9SS type A sorting domain-containing protein n=1 Tax=Mariniflexile soesokkakense TaxID=1343160 RepID=A0ABV0ACZ4_9FLAO